MGLDEKGSQERDEALKNMHISSFRNNDKHYMFVSYKSDDWKTVFGDVVIPLMENYGLKIYADKAFDYSNQTWLEQMKSNMEYSSGVLLFISNEYVRSYATFLELLYAIKLNKEIIPIYLCGTASNLSMNPAESYGKEINMREWEREELIQVFEGIHNQRDENRRKKVVEDVYWDMNLQLKNNELREDKLYKAFMRILEEGAFQDKSVLNGLDGLYQTICSVDENVCDKHLIKQAIEAKEIKKATTTISKTGSVGVNGAVKTLDWINWKGKLPEVQEGSFVIEYKNMKCQNCKNWAGVWRELLEILGQDSVVKDRILQLRDSEIRDNKYSLKTFFDGQVNLKKGEQYTHSHHVKSLDIDVENYWNKENMCREIKKLCKALELDMTDIVIKGIPLE